MEGEVQTAGDPKVRKLGGERGPGVGGKGRLGAGRGTLLELSTGIPVVELGFNSTPRTLSTTACYLSI